MPSLSGIEIGAAGAGAARGLGVYEGMVPDSAASMLNPRPADAVPNAGGSMRVVVRRRFRMPMRLRVGERPAGAE